MLREDYSRDLQKEVKESVQQRAEAEAEDAEGAVPEGGKAMVMRASSLDQAIQQWIEVRSGPCCWQGLGERARGPRLSC